MAYTPVSLATFTLASGGGAVNLGTDDCWLERWRDEEVNAEYIKVHCRYLNDTGSPTQIEGAVRLAAQNYVRDLVDSIGGITKHSSYTVGRHSRLLIEPRYDRGTTDYEYGKGTLTDPFTSQTYTDCYLKAVTQEDDGWRGHEFTLTFFREIAETSSPSTVTFNSVVLGNNPFYTPVVVFGDGYSLRYRVQAVVTNTDRAALQTNVESIITALKPLELVTKNTPTGRALTLAPGAVVSSLVQAGDLAFSVADVTCTAIDVEDDGSTHATLTLTFAKSLYSEVTDPTTDGRVAKYKGTALGNDVSVVNSAPSDPHFIRYEVTARYKGSDYITYPTTLADTLGWYPLNAIQYPRGALTNQGVIKSYRQVPGTLSLTSGSLSVTNMYMEDYEVSRVEGTDEVVINFTFIKVR